MGKQAKPQREPPRDDEGFIVLTGELFWRWKATHEAIARCDAEIKLRTPMIEQLLEAQPQLKQLIGERTSFVMQLGTTRAEYNAIMKQLEDHFGFPMKNVSIDDVSGRVHRLEEGASDDAAPPPPVIKNGHNKAATDSTKKSKKRK